MNSPRSFLILRLVAVLIVVGAASGCSKGPRVKDTKCLSEGEDAIARGRVAKAIVCFEKEIELNPKNPAPHLRLALIYEHLERDPAKADHYYEQYLALETNEAKRERVERWRQGLDDEVPTPALSPEAESGNGADPKGGPRIEIEAAQERVRQLEQENEQFAARIIELEGIGDELEASKQNAARLTRERDDFQAQRDTQARNAASLTKQLDDIKAKHDTAARESSAKIADLQKKTTTLENENKTLVARVKDLEAERSRSGRRSLSKRLDEARAALKQAEDKNAAYARQVEELQRRIAALEAQGGASNAATDRSVIHEVQRGETLRTISLKYYGTKDHWSDIYEANRSAIPDPNDIKVGQKLVIPLEGAQ